MIIHNCEQGSVEWMLLRAGKATASEFHNLISPTWEPRKGEMVSTFVAEKAAEWWLGGPLPQFTGWDSEQGNVLESEARPWASLELNQEIQKVGFITTDDGLAGCSPDGLLPGCGVEIKCLQPEHHVKCLLRGGVPKEYGAQIHGGMWVTGYTQWKLVLYSRTFPSIILDVQRDEEIQDVITEALSDFLARLEAAKERLTEVNGGPPKRRKSLEQVSEEFLLGREINV